MPLLIGLAAVAATFLGGLFALRRQDKLHLILSFSAGAVIGVAFFDLLPESLELTAGMYDVASVTAVIAAGFLAFMLLNQVLLLHPHASGDDCHSRSHQGRLAALSLALHSFLDGLAIGLAFQVSSAVGVIVALAVLAHDFSDGINTVGLVLAHKGGRERALRWLAADALAPLLGILAARFLTLPAATLGLLLALFCGFFLYIGASDLLPESHHRHPKLVTSLLTVLGALAIYGAVTLAR